MDYLQKGQFSKFVLGFLSVIKNKWVKVFKNGPSKLCGRQPLKI